MRVSVSLKYPQLMSVFIPWRISMMWFKLKFADSRIQAWGVGEVVQSYCLLRMTVKALGWKYNHLESSLLNSVSSSILTDVQDNENERN